MVEQEWAGRGRGNGLYRLASARRNHVVHSFEYVEREARALRRPRDRVGDESPIRLGHAPARPAQGGNREDGSPSPLPRSADESDRFPVRRPRRRSISEADGNAYAADLPHLDPVARRGRRGKDDPQSDKPEQHAQPPFHVTNATSGFLSPRQGSVTRCASDPEHDDVVPGNAEPLASPLALDDLELALHDRPEPRRRILVPLPRKTSFGRAPIAMPGCSAALAPRSPTPPARRRNRLHHAAATLSTPVDPAVHAASACTAGTTDSL
jgi:hypothetical protein